MPKMTKAQIKQWAKHEKWVSAAMDLVYLAAPNDQTPFSECYKLASPDVRKQHDDARKALMDFEFKMADEQRGWFERGRFRDYGDPHDLRRYGAEQ